MHNFKIILDAKKASRQLYKCVCLKCINQRSHMLYVFFSDFFSIGSTQVNNPQRSLKKAGFNEYF